MLKRQFRNFRTDHVATVTIVFQASRPVMVRWFRSDPRQAMLTDSEVPGMMPVEGACLVYIAYVRLFDCMHAFVDACLHVCNTIL